MVGSRQCTKCAGNANSCKCEGNMEKQFMLEIVNHNTGDVTGSDKGRPEYLGKILPYILGELDQGCGITITLMEE